MQTFVPYPDMERSVATLDRQRLGKQRVETFQILLQLHSVGMDEDGNLYPRDSLWRHAAVEMWSGSERALLRYQEATCRRWIDEFGYADSCLEKSIRVVEAINTDPDSEQLPPWWGDEHVHMTHRSNLVWKNLNFYGPQFPDDIPADPFDEAQYWEYDYRKGRIPRLDRVAEHLEVANRLLLPRS